MLALNEDAWRDLRHAQGDACDIPAYLRQLAAFPEGDGRKDDPYASLWRLLLYKRCVYTASYAALPHMVEMMGDVPERAHASVLELVTRMEIARARGNGPPMEGAMAVMYQKAIDRLPEVIARMAQHAWDERFTRLAAAALAVAKGQPTLAEAILELKPDKLANFMDTVAADE